MMALGFIFVFVFVLLILFVLLPLVLALVTSWRIRVMSNSCDRNKGKMMNWNSSLFVGRMWHCRLGEATATSTATATSAATATSTAEDPSEQSTLQSQSISHAFSYPLFMFAIDLAEVEEHHLFSNILWPLSLLLNFNDKDHLKNGEGIMRGAAEVETETETETSSNQLSQLQSQLQLQPQPQPPRSVTLSERIYALIAQRTQNKFQPTAQSHSIILVTHLQYYGYCFNPVSFYYILSKQHQPSSQQQQQQQQQDVVDNSSSSPLIPSSRLAAIVAEVSNTPWNEMYPYVLHPDSTDNVQVQYHTTTTTNSSTDDDMDEDDGENKKKKKTTTTTTAVTVNYVFRKRFHVSPFMEMQYYYDWQFDDAIVSSSHLDDSTALDNNMRPSSSSSGSRKQQRRIHVLTNMRKIRHDNNNDSDSDSDREIPGELKFRGGMKVVEAMQSSTSLSNSFSSNSSVSATIFHDPLLLAWHALMRYPVYCLIVQLWIHYQALHLFYKGVTFQPHPHGTETIASRWIGRIMTPFFALQEIIWAKKRYRRATSNNSGSSSSVPDGSKKKKKSD
jgi:uncharacterized protein